CGAGLQPFGRCVMERGGSPTRTGWKPSRSCDPTAAGRKNAAPTRCPDAAATVLVIRVSEQKEGAATGFIQQPAVDRQTVAQTRSAAFFGIRGAARLRDRVRKTASSRHDGRVNRTTSVAS